MSKILQNFYKSTITLDWTIGTGNFYVAQKPVPTDGWLVISPNNATTREIVKYTATGTDANGDYITVTERGVDNTDEQIHTIGEPIRMNITAEYWADMVNDINDIVASGVSNATTTSLGGVELATDAEALAGTDISGAGHPLAVLPSQVKLLSNYVTPVVRAYTPTRVGSSTTQFDITNPAGTTFRYTWDSTGTDPVINTTTFPVGSRVRVHSESFSNGNRGVFTLTGSGTNYFEVTNASGVAENDKTLGAFGYLEIIQKTTTWTKPAGLKYVIAEVVGGGGAGGGVDGSGSSPDNLGSGGGAGGYSRKLIAASSLGATETVTVGAGGNGVYASSGGNGSTTSFGSIMQATGGTGGILLGDGGIGGIGSGGDINVRGGSGSYSDTDSNGNPVGNGGSSVLGGGGAGAINGKGGDGGFFGGGGGGSHFSVDYPGGDGASGCVIVTEFY